MKTNLMIILLMVLFPSCAFSGEIYGCIKKGKKFIISPLLVKLLKLLLLGAKRLGLLGASLVRISQLSQNVQN